MNRSEKVRILIKKMSPTEKRYFSVFASQHKIGEKNVYKRLFEFICANDHYDDDGLRNHFKGERFVKRLSHEFGHLYELLLKALRAYRAESNSDLKILEAVANASILLDKGLYELADEQIIAGKRVAREKERFWILLRLLQLERISIQRNQNQGTDDMMFARINETHEALGIIYNFFDARDLYDRVFVKSRRSNSPRKKTEREEFEKLIRDAKIQEEEEAVSIFSKILFHSARAQNCHVLRDFDASLVHRRRIVELYEQNSFLCEDSNAAYTVALANLATVYMIKRDKDKFDATMQKMAATKIKTFNDNIEFEQNYCYLRFMFAINTADVTTAIEVLGELEGVLETIGNMMNPARLMASYGSAVMFRFITADFETCKNMIEDFLDRKKEYQRQDVMHQLILLLPIVYYELKYYKTVLSKCNMARRLLKKEGRLYSFETKVLNFVQKLPDKADSVAVGSACKKFKESLEELQNDPGEKIIFSYKEISYWLESKITRQPMIELYKLDVGDTDNN